MKALLETLKSWGPLGAFVIAFIDGAGLPNPGGPDYLIVFLAAVRPETAYLAALLTTAGSLAGAMCLFWLARKGGEKYLERHAQSPRAQKFRTWFARFGLITVFVPALMPIVPLPMKVFVLCAGALGTSPAVFLALMALGRIPRYFGLAWFGREYGAQSWTWLIAHRRQLYLVALVLGILGYLLVKWFERRRHAPGCESIN
jgi:membrane protein YqaA with SNARE-associated domain